MYWMNLLVMKYKCPIPAAWNFVSLTYSVETFGLLNCTCSYGMTLCKCSVTPSMSLSCGLGLAKFLSQLPFECTANWTSSTAHTSHRPPNSPDVILDATKNANMQIHARARADYSVPFTSHEDMSDRRTGSSRACVRT